MKNKCSAYQLTRHLCSTGSVLTLAAVTLLLAALTGSAKADDEQPIVQNEVGAAHLIRPADLPPPFSSESVNNGQHVVPMPPGAVLHVPPGFTISRWASGLTNPRWLQVAPNGDVFVSESAAGRVSILRSGQNGKATITHFATGLSQPFGIAFYPNGPDPRYIYVADTDAVLRFPYRNGDSEARGGPEKIADLTPGGYNQHWTRTIVFSPDSKKLYIAVGSRENIGIEDPPRAAVMICNPDGSDMHVFATGLRNAVGLSFNPVTGTLWGAVNERDGMGDKLPPDYLTSIKPGGFYGWPYYYIGRNHDPRMPERPDLAAKVIVPDVLLEPHCAALSIEWDTRSQFPAPYHNDGFVATHGSWNRSDPVGYKVMWVPMNPDGTPKGGYRDFAWGWKLDDGRVWGRPVSLAFLKDGSMVLSDDGGNCVWHISYKGTR